MLKSILRKNDSNVKFEIKDKVKLELLVELASLDKFQKELFTLAKTESGSATLYGY